jgi:glutamate-1-semialdehyde 2,1-aminomutase
MLIAPYNDLETATTIIEAHHHELAAVIIEPLQRVLAPLPGFLAGLRGVTARYQVPLIFDEVVTGFRLAYGGAQEYYGVTPDLCAVGKIMGGGYPLAAVMGRSDIMSMYDQGAAASDDFVGQTGTLNGNPIACAAGLATLAELRKPGAYEKLRQTGGLVRQALVDICAENGVPVQSSGDDAIFDVFFTDKAVHSYRDGLAADAQMLGRFNAGLLEQGVLKSWPQKFYPSLAHTQEDVERTIEAFRHVVKDLKR